MRNCEQNIAPLIQIALLGAIAVFSLCVAPGFAATISRSAEIEAALVAIWSLTGLSETARNWLAPFNSRATHQIDASL